MKLEILRKLDIIGQTLTLGKHQNKMKEGKVSAQKNLLVIMKSWEATTPQSMVILDPIEIAGRIKVHYTLHIHMYITIYYVMPKSKYF